MTAAKPHVLVMAGGTGGHVFPGLAVATVLRGDGCRVSWLGSARGMETRLVPEAGLELFTLPVTGLRGKDLVSRLLAPWRLGISLWSALALMLRLRPDVVVGFGGFASGPGGLMASALGRPLLLHEQNAVAGLTNRWLARIADQVFAAFPDSFPESVGCRTIGNPIRRDIAAIPAPGSRWSGRKGPLRLLVLGGSLGARKLNEVVPAALATLAPDARPQVRHQAGERTLDTAREAYRAAGVDAEITAFMADMAAAYAWADLVVCRAGALTVSEVAAVGLAAVFVPYPHAVDDHQTANARFLVSAGAAWSIPDPELSAGRLGGLLASLDRPTLLERAERARAEARTHAAEKLAEACIAAAPERSRRKTR
ncbi:undecaprenyldiphospho-muramoylpentapeptide beta-N-acetylglucosaminyltransferase [Thioalkalivibrio sp.]|uniref:undecaprenyldiphospho-muramoylpentapeptide beta-N-acetylglucosaminyltransferase n=1 Tax=Thioalkalivibrio sp. TaxID=2093813 RepID=UPI003974E87C